MNWNDVGVILGTAVLAMVIGVVLWQMPAAKATEGRTPARQPGKITINGTQLTLAFDKASYNQADEPVIVLTATGAGDCEQTVNLNLTSTRPSSPLSRMVALPKSIWAAPCSITLKSGEKKRVELPTEVAVEAGHTLTLAATAGELRTMVSAVVAADGANQLVGAGVQKAQRRGSVPSPAEGR